MLIKRKPEGLGVAAFQLASFILGLIFLLPFYLVELYLIPSQSISSSMVFSILYIGIFASLLAFILWNKAISIIGAVNAGLVYYSLPIFSGILAILILNESITILHFYSTLLILLGIILAVIYKPILSHKN
jgi:drug/metabolite transporter (DMT)-like permease